MSLHEQPAKLWTKNFITLTICMLLLLLNLHMLLSSFPLFLKNEFMATDFTVSLITGAFAVSAIASRLFVVPLMRVMNYKVVLMAGLALATVSTFLNVLVQSVTFLIMIRIGFGLGFGLASTIIPTMISRVVPGSRLGEGIGYFGLGGSLAMSIGPILGLNIMESSGFSTLSWFSTAVILLIFPLIFMLRTKTSTLEAQSNVKKEVDRPQVKVKITFPMLLPAFLNFLLSVIYSGLLSFIALYGAELQLEQVGLFFLFNAFALMVVRPLSGRLFDRKGHIVVILPAAFSVIGSLLLLSYATSITMVIMSAILYGLGSGAIQPTLQAWMLSKVTRADHGLVNSIFFNSTDLGVALGALMLGVIASMSSYAAMYLYASGFMLLFLAVYIVSLLPKKHSRPVN